MLDKLLVELNDNPVVLYGPMPVAYGPGPIDNREMAVWTAREILSSLPKSFFLVVGIITALIIGFVAILIKKRRT